MSPSFPQAPRSVRVGAVSRVGVAIACDATAGNALDTVARAGQWIAEEDGLAQHTDSMTGLSVSDLRVSRATAARPCRAGVLNAEPGGGRASGAAQRRRSCFFVSGNSAAGVMSAFIRSGRHHGRWPMSTTVTT